MFEVGKKVICIKSHPYGIVKRGQIFELFGIRDSLCKCGNIQLDVGIREYEISIATCSNCGADTVADSEIWWINNSRFAPFDNEMSDTTVEELIEEIETELQNT